MTGGEDVGVGGGSGRVGVLVSKIRQIDITSLGKGPGIVGFAYFAAILLFILSLLEKDVAGLTGPLGLLTAGLFGGSAWKAAAEAKNGGVK